MIPLSSIIVNIDAIDNAPRVRSLTASFVWNPKKETTFIPYTEESNVRWNIKLPKNFTNTKAITAITPDGKNYTFQQINLLSAMPVKVSPLVLKINTPLYKPAYEDYTLYNFSLNCTQIYGKRQIIRQLSATYFTCDNFPDIGLNVKINYENSRNSNFFYRLTSKEVYAGDITVESDYLPQLNKTLKRYNYNGVFYINDKETTSTLFTTKFNRALPGVSSVMFKLTARSVTFNGTPVNFYTTHKYTESLSAVFVTSFPQAEFIAYPTYVFRDAFTQVNLISSGYTYTQGLCFYGEGHTETINLSAQYNSNIQDYIWKIGRMNPSVYSYNAATTSVKISSTIGSYPMYPISLLVTNSVITSSAPAIYFDDKTGIKKYYPYYTSTLNTDNIESSTNTKLKQSISVMPYDKPRVTLKTDFSSNVIMLPTRDVADNTSIFCYSYNDAPVCEPCYGRYGIEWKWSNFQSVSGNPNAFTNLPTSWAETVSGGIFEKLWQYQPAAINNGNIPIGWFAGSTVWNLSTSDWSVKSFNVGNEYPSSLLYNNSTPYTKAPFTINQSKEETELLVTAVNTLTGRIVAEPYDWKVKTTRVFVTSAITVLGRPTLRLYTPNRYVLLNTPVLFENITTLTNKLDCIYVFLNDQLKPIITLSGNNINRNFNMVFKRIGPVTLQLSGITTNGNSISKTFNNIIDVVSNYDTVSVPRYITNTTPLMLPYENAPLIAPNDNGVADVINDVIKKFYTNLDYLKMRSVTYGNFNTIPIGWLGNVTLSSAIVSLSTSSVDNYTWEDLDCSINPDTALTWKSFYC